MIPAWLTRRCVDLWWWVQGVDQAAYNTRCGRWGHNGRVHLADGGCWRFVPPVADWWSRRR
jgi:hypothetical protein